MANKQTKANRADAAKCYQKGQGPQTYSIPKTMQGGSRGARLQTITVGKCARLSKFAKVAAKRSKGARSNDNATA